VLPGFRSADGAEMTTPETLDWEISTLNYFFFGGMPAGTADVELYRTDGTEGGTVLVKEINPAIIFPGEGASLNVAEP